MRYEIHQVLHLEYQQTVYLIIDTQQNIMTGCHPTMALCINNITQTKFKVNRSSFTSNLITTTSDLTTLMITHPELFI